MNFLSSLLVQITTYGLVPSVDLNFIGDYIGWLIKIVGSVGIGIILFTLTLKLIVLPFDVISRVSTKKNAVKMEMMRPELEKLQKQYANDKSLYQQKMMALYKKNGYSAFGACLPSLFSIVFFIIAIGAFNNYAKFSVVNEFNSMIDGYNTAITEYIEADENDLFEIKEGSEYYNVKEEKFYDNVLATKYPDYAAILSGDYANRTLVLTDKTAVEKVYTNSIVLSESLLFDEATSAYKLITPGTEAAITDSLIEEIIDKYIDAEIKPLARESAAENYTDSVNKFLWVKNIWRSDVSYTSPFPKTRDDWKTLSGTDKITDAVFNEITANIVEEKSEPNGYFILVVLSIGTMLLSQLIMQKSQKAQLELQSVDGQAAQTQKMMTWMMPIMFGIFAFSYSSAFCIYMVVSSIVSTLSMLIINFSVEFGFKRKLERQANSVGYSKRGINAKYEEKKQGKKK